MRRILIGLVVCVLTCTTTFASDLVPDSSIDVVGYGELTVEPDMYQLNCKLYVVGDNEDEVRPELNRQLGLFRMFADSVGRDALSLSSGSLDVVRWQYRSNRWKMSGMSVQLNIVLRNPSIYGDVIEALSQSGVRWPVSVTGKIATDTLHQDRLLRLALQDAKRQAEVTAEVLDVKLTQPVRVVIDAQSHQVRNRLHGTRVVGHMYNSMIHEFVHDISGELPEIWVPVYRFVAVKFAMQPYASFGGL